jgi:uncharacterized protein YndB with AHSA1/START domain
MDPTARAVADLADGLILATVELPVAPEDVFPMLASDRIVEWWVRPGVFDTRTWAGDVRVGGRWQASGVGNGRPYTLEGLFVEIDAPHRLSHTWHPGGDPAAVTTVTYLLEPVAGGTRLTLRHSGFTSRQVCSATCTGWETSFRRLAELCPERPTTH